MPPRVKSSEIIITIQIMLRDPNNATSYLKNDEVIKMTTNNQLRLPLLLIALIAFIAVPIAAQSPNTATIIVAVFDQAGAVVKDAKVLAMNTATGDGRVVGEGTIDELRAQANLSEGGSPEAGLEEIFLALT
jgi:hypothetical protein